ncbi:hypothetical protein Tco_0083904 [Tanacetum coccineum]
MHNDIMAAGSKDHPPMLATGRYAQWQSRCMRYVNTKPNMKELKKCIFNGPYVMTRVLVPTKLATETDPHLEWSRLVMVIKQTLDLDKESYHKLFGILKQYQNEVNEIHAEKIAKNANPLAIVADAQQYPNDNYYHAPIPHKHQTTFSRHTSLTSSHAPTRTKGKEVVKPRTRPSLSASTEDSDP